MIWKSLFEFLLYVPSWSVHAFRLVFMCTLRVVVHGAYAQSSHAVLTFYKCSYKWELQLFTNLSIYNIAQ